MAHGEPLDSLELSHWEPSAWALGLRAWWISAITDEDRAFIRDSWFDTYNARRYEHAVAEWKVNSDARRCLYDLEQAWMKFKLTR